MNQYETNTSFKPKQATWQNTDSLNPEYSYAYCEPIIKKNIQSPQPKARENFANIPISMSNIELCKTHKPGNSLRALLTKSFRKTTFSHPEDRHTFTTHYGKKENIYEDVDRVVGQSGTKPKHRFSNESVGKIPLDEELKFVELQHDRVMNELNLSIEELLMPSQSEADQLEQQMLQIEDIEQDAKQDKFDILKRSAPLISSKLQFNPYFDIDSGISGSSSSTASYAGSVRYRSHYTSSRNTTIYEIPGNFKNHIGRNLSSFDLINDEQTKTEAVLSYTDQCASYCFQTNAVPTHNSTNLIEPEKRIETISEKVILWNKTARIEDTSISTKCKNSKGHQQNYARGPP